MFQSILVPLDRSSFAEQALPLAFAIARRARAEIDLAEVHSLYCQDDPTACWVPYEPDRDVEWKQKEKLYLDATAKFLNAVSPIAVTTCVLTGSASVPMTIANALLERAQARRPDLIVMATHGRGPLGCFSIGSVADELVRRTQVPILLVRTAETRLEFVPEPTLDNILIPLDGSALAEQVLEPVLDIARLMEARCLLVQVVVDNPLSLVSEQERAEAYLEQVAERIRHEGLSVRTQVVAARDEAKAILEVVEAQRINLVAITTQGHSEVRRLLGSVADKIIRGAAKPVLVYHPTGRKR